MRPSGDKPDDDPVDKDPLGLRAQATIFLVALPVLIVALAIGKAPWFAYPLLLAMAAAIWATAFTFAPKWFDWVRGDR